MPFIRPFAAAIGAGCLVASIAMASGAAQAQQPTPKASKQPAQAQPAKPQAEPPQLKQIALTEQQIEHLLAAQKEIDAIAEKLPDTPNAKPDPKITAQFDDAAKRNGFADYGEYNDVLDNVTLVLGGFDPQSKTYVGPEAVLKSQIAAVQADKKMPAKDKKAALAEMNEALKTPAPAIENKGNIDLVTKYYDKLAAALQDDQ